MTSALSASRLMRWSVPRILFAVLLSLVSPIVAPPAAFAGPGTVTNGSCASSVGEVTNVTIAQVGNDCIISFKNVGTTTWTVPTSVREVELLVVAGGGAGGTRAGGGGGAGGFVYLTSVNVTPAASVSLTVGAGGANSNTSTQGQNGGDSTFGLSSVVTAKGGGGGGTGNGGLGNYAGLAGGSSGGSVGNTYTPAAANQSGQNYGFGNNGAVGSQGASSVLWTGGGGGGAGGAGTAGNTNGNAGTGGAGRSNSITGSAVCYAAGGGGGNEFSTSGSAGAGGNCGGSAVGGAGSKGNTAAGSGTANTGSGGGGSGFQDGAGGGNGTPGSGGSGVVIVRWTIPGNAGAFPNIDGISARFNASNFNTTLNSGLGTWADSSGTGKHITGTNITGTAITLSTTGSNANGSTKSFNVLNGTSSSNMLLLSPANMTGKYTLFSVARYSGATKGRIFQGTAGNYLSGFWNTYSGVMHKDAWQTLASQASDIPQTNWVMSSECSYDPSPVSNSCTSTYSAQGMQRSTVTNTYTGAYGLAINNKGNSPTETADFQIADVIVFNRVLTIEEVNLVEAYLSNKYGLTTYGEVAASYDPGDTNSYSSATPTLLKDLSGNGLDITLYNSPKFNSLSGGNLEFLNTSSQWGQTTGNLRPLTRYTAEVWVKPGKSQATGDYTAILTQPYTSTGQIIGPTFIVSGSATPAGRVFGGYWNGGSWQTSSSPFVTSEGYQTVPGTWVHLVNTYDGAFVKTYVDGVLHSQIASTSNSLALRQLRIAQRWDGAAGSAYGYSGSFGAIKITDHALTAGEVQAAYNASINRYSPACTPTSSSSGGYTTLTFTSVGDCSWTTPASLTSAEVLVVGGGGGGGAGGFNNVNGNGGGGGGGGGGAQVVSQTASFTGNAKVTVSIGAGGVGGTTGGRNSSSWAGTHGRSGTSSAIGSVTASGGEAGFGGGNWALGSSSDTTCDRTRPLTIDGVNIFYIDGVGGRGGNSGNTSFTGGRPFCANNKTTGLGGSGVGGAGSGASTANLGSLLTDLRPGGAGTSSSLSGSAVEYGTGGSGGAGGNSGATPESGSTGARAGMGGNGGGGSKQGDNASIGAVGGAGASGVVIVKYANPPSISLSTSTINATIGTAVTSYTVTNTGGPITSYSVSPALPAGISLNTSTGVLSGTPTAYQASTVHTLTATNGGGTATSTFTLSSIFTACSPTSVTSGGFVVLTFTSTSDCSWQVPSGVTAVDVLAVGGGGGGGPDGGSGGGGGELRTSTSYSLSGIPSLVLDAGTGGTGGNWIGGVAATAGTSSFVKNLAGSTLFEAKGGRGGNGWGSNTTAGVGGTGGAGGTGTNGQNGGIGPGSSCAAGSRPSGNTPSSTITGSTVFYGGGGGGGSGYNGKNSGASILGVSGDGTNNTSGVTSGGRGASYKIARDGTATSGASRGSNGTANTGGGGGAGAACDAYGDSGATFGSNVTIDGVNYLASDVTNGRAQRTSGGNGADGVVILRYPVAPSITLSASSISGSVNVAITTLTVTNTGGPATFSVSPSLPTGLSLNTSTGAISGTPTVTKTTTTHTLTATNSSGTSTGTFTLVVTLPSCTPTTTNIAGFTVLTFTSTTECRWVVPTGVTTTEVLIVGGGGGGGGTAWAGGGGGGGVLYASSQTVSPADAFEIAVGAGGAGGTSTAASSKGSNGSNTTVSFTVSGTRTTYTARGGGGGGGYGWGSSVAVGTGVTGGSSGGHGEMPSGTGFIASVAGTQTNSGSFTGYANAGGSMYGAASQAGSGGGGAGGVGGNVTAFRGPGAGGAGRLFSITGGSGTTYAGGGGGASVTGAAGGSGGGGAGASGSANGTNGTNGLGGGGGGGMSVGGSGGSGVVVVRYANSSNYSYNLNGGSGTTPASGTATSGTNFTTASTSGFSRSGFTFTGWNTAANGSGTSFAAGASVVMPSSPTATVLFAQWKPNIAITVPSSIAAPSSSTDYALSGISVTNLDSTKSYLVSIGLTGVGTSGGVLKFGTTTGLTPSYGYTDTNASGGKDMKGGFTNMSFTVAGSNQAQLNTNLNTLMFRYANNNVSKPFITITVTENSVAGIAYNPANGHYYLAQTGVKPTWTEANALAKASTYLGQSGYLVTITSADEMAFVASNISGASNIWIGATDTDVEGLWKWASDGGSPEAGKKFWKASCVNDSFASTCTTNSGYSATGGANVTADGINYSNWSSGEPNNYFSGTAENYAVANWTGSSGWNDLRNTETANIGGYVIEYGTNAPGNGFATGNLSATSSPIAVQTRPSVTYSGTPFTFVRGTAITPVSPSNAGGAATSYSISPSLPSGLTFNTTTGQISGTPTVSSSSTSYTVTAIGDGGSTSTTISIQIDLARFPYTITFGANGGTGTMAPQTGTASSVQLSASSFTRAGYTFAGWRDAGNNAFTDSQTVTLIAPVTLALTAQWTQDAFKITYLLNGGTGSVPVDNNGYLSSETATVLSKPNNLARTGYTFAGWTENSDGTGTVYNSGSVFTVSNNTSLNAKWEPKIYTVSYNRNGFTGTGWSASSYTVGTSAINLPDATGKDRPGYDFGGWSLTPTGASVGTSYTPTQDITLYAIWNTKTITATFNSGAGAPSLGTLGVAASASALFNTTITLPLIDSDPKTVNGAPAIFVGWNDGTLTYASGATYRMPASNLTITAQWAPLLEVQYVLNGGVFSTSRTVFDSQCVASLNKCTENQPIQLDEAPVRTGYTFAGWRVDGSNIKAALADHTVTSSSYIYLAQWTPNPSSITYNTAGGSGSVPSTFNVGMSETFTVTSGVSKAHYTFVGWADQGSAIYGPGSIYTVESSTVTLTAQWAPNTYKVTYDWNGGRLASGSATTSANYTYPSDGSTPAGITLYNGSGYEKEGFTFVGWSDTSTASTGISGQFIPTADTTLYAVWNGEFSVTKNFNGSGASPEVVGVPIRVGGVLGVPTRTDYRFAGWYDAATFGNLINNGVATYIPTKNITLYARWVQASLFGISTTSLFEIAKINVNASGSGTTTIIQNNGKTVEEGGTQVSVSVPQGAFGKEAQVTIYSVGDFSRARSLIGAANDYKLSLVIAWVATDGSVPDTLAGKPIVMTITNQSIKRNASIFKLIGDSVTVLGLATEDGSISVQITQDPEVLVAATKPEPPTGVSATNLKDAKSTVSWVAPVNNGGATINEYVVASSGGQTCRTSGLSCDVLGLTNGTSYTFTVRAINDVGSSDSSTVSSAITPRAPGPQIVTWTPTTSLVLSDSPNSLDSFAIADGGGAISYSVVSAGTTGCTVDEFTGELTFTAVGSCSVKATAAPIGDFTAGERTVTFVIGLASRTLTISADSYRSTYVITSSAPSLTASQSRGGGEVTFSSSTTSVCTIGSTSGQVTFVASGTCQISAAISASGDFAAATAPTITFTITRSTQTVTWDPLTSLQLSQSPFTPATATTNGDGTIVYSIVSAGGTNCSVDSSTGVLTYTGAGNCSVKATAPQTVLYSENSKTVNFTIIAPPNNAAGAINSTAQVALYFKVVNPDNQNQISNVPTCVSLYTRDLNPQFIGTSCTVADGNINLLSGPASVAIYVFEQANQADKKVYFGTISKETFEVEDSRYFPGTTRWIVSTPSKSAATPTPTPKPSSSPSASPSASATPTPSPTASSSASPSSPTTPRPQPSSSATPKPSLPNSLNPVQTAIGLKPGEFSTLLDGKLISATIKPTAKRDGLEISGPGWSLVISALGNDGKTRPLAPSGILDFRVNGKVRVTGTGSIPNAELRIYLLANVVLLESTKSNTKGGYSITMDLPREITQGTHVLQVNTQTPSKQIRSLSIGLFVNATGSAQNPNPSSTTRPNPSASPTPTATKPGVSALPVVPFSGTKYGIGAQQMSAIKILNLSGKNVNVFVVGYVKATGTREDLRISLDRAIEVKKAILKIAPKAKVTVLGGGGTIAPECRAVSNQCVTVRVAKG